MGKNESLNIKFSPRTLNQEVLASAIASNQITLCHGPPGTGKTHVAAAKSIAFKRLNLVQKIVITRPVVPSGRDIGYLPGGMEEKVAPYLAPLFDELQCYCLPPEMRLWMDTNQLEIVPLCMMRGRTFNDAFVILDEAQNATREELRMFFTRIGKDSRVVASGDLNQSDLPPGQRGGFSDAIECLQGIESIATVEFTPDDIVRNPLIAEIDRRLACIQ